MPLTTEQRDGFPAALEDCQGRSIAAHHIDRSSHAVLPDDKNADIGRRAPPRMLAVNLICVVRAV